MPSVRRPSRFTLAVPLVLLLSTAACGRSGLDDLTLGGGAGLGSGGGSTAPGGAGGSGDGGAGPGGPGGGDPSGPGPGPGPGTGGFGPCSSALECDDGDFCTTDVCVDGTCDARPRDDDGDGSAPFSCNGTDCNDQNAQVFPGHGETCGDGSDNDCNGVSDCFDPACRGVPDCGCVAEPEGCTNGVDDDCDGFADCFDLDCAGIPACGCADAEPPFCSDGFDQDCDGAIDCDDDECAATPACLCLGAFEGCQDGQDDDCDGLIDCADADCAGLFPCTCVGAPQPEQCGNLADDDCDQLVDCADPDCFLSPSCDDCTVESCGNGVDDDCDGRIDCADEACLFAPECEPEPEICNNGVDDDGDGLADCLDPDCAAAPLCQDEQSSCLTSRFIPGGGTYTGDTTGNPPLERGACGGGAGEAVFDFILDEPARVHVDTVGTSFDSTLHVRAGACPNPIAEIGCDDDSGGNFAAALDFTILYPGHYFVFVDGFTIDPFGGADEGPFVLNVEIEENPSEICQNGSDDDGDVFVDCADSDCTDAPGCAGCVEGGDPRPEWGPAACTDGVDDDCDGAVDCSDEDCSASDFYVTECCDGVDENGNGIVDDFNCRCATDADCDGGQICYTHTEHVCGARCDQFFGVDVCPSIAPGSFCSQATGQCEF